MATQQTPAEPARIGVGEAKRLFDEGKAIFVDVRKREVYEQAHVPGAVAMPLPEVPRRFEELPRDQELVFY